MALKEEGENPDRHPPALPSEDDRHSFTDTREQCISRCSEQSSQSNPRFIKKAGYYFPSEETLLFKQVSRRVHAHPNSTTFALYHGSVSS